MKIEYEYIYFELEEQKPKTTVWSCRNKNSGDLIGEIKWYGSWRQYCFYPWTNTIFSKGCLEDINTFITILMEKRKIDRKNIKSTTDTSG